LKATGKIRIFAGIYLEALSNLPPEDRKQLTLKSVHSIRYLWLHKQNKNFNYFNLENENYLHVITQIFPVFSKADAFFKKIHENTIRNLCLDSKEFSLYSALIIFVGGSFRFFRYCHEIFSPANVICVLLKVTPMANWN
jgi:hypothetical protein